MRLRTALALAVTLPALAAAQPANDTCAGALPIPPTSGFARNRSPVSAPFGSASAAEAAMSCAPIAQNTVWYSFTPAESGRYEFASCPGRAYLATSLKDFAMAVYSGPCTALAEVADGCNDDWCGTQPRVVVELTAGETYRVQVGRYDTAAEATDAIQLSVARTGGAASCAGPVPDLPMNTSVPVATLPGETNDAQVGGGAACFTGLGHLTGPESAGPLRDRVLRFTAPRAGAYSFRTGASARAFDTVLYLTDSCVAASSPPQIYGPPNQCLAAANRTVGTTSAQEEVSCVPLSAGQQVYVWVDEGLEQTAPANGGTVNLEVTDCRFETEPNDTPATASGLACNLTAAIQTGGDVDFFSLGTPAAGSRLFAMAETISAGSASQQLQMRVTTGTDTVEFDTADLDTEFGGSSPGLAGTPLTAVPHYLRISHDTASTGVLQPYHVYAVLQSGAPTPEVEPNDTPATATTGANNYFRGTSSSTSDFDFFAFEARAGDLVYLALDTVPDRVAGAGANHSLALWNAAGQQLFVNDANTVVNVSPSNGTLTSTLPAGPSEHLVYRVPATGLYWARVGREHATNPNADYLLSISIDCGAGGGLTSPSLSSVTPATGSSLGGELVTLSGAGFGVTSSVRFGGREATVSDVTPLQLVVRTPVGDDGPADVSVSNFGHAASTLSGAFTFVTPAGPPVVADVTPSQGVAAGGQRVTVTGQLFKPGAEVTFDVGGDVRAGTAVNVLNLAQLTVVTPAHVPGAATVTVRNPADGLSGSLPNGYRFNGPPTLTAVSPATGLISGGATVTLTGTRFVSGALVRFGTGAGTAVNVDPSGESLTVVTPAAATYGLVHVVVINPDGQQTRLNDGFRYQLPAPALSAVTPASGPSSGGTSLTLTGTDFFDAPTVLVNDVPASNVTRLSATQVTAVTPPGTPGVVNVALANTDGQQATLVGAFAYVAAPTVTSLSPANGPALGGTRITLTGADFQQGALVRIGGSPAFAVTVTSATTLTALTPAGPEGAADVEVINADSQRGVLAGGFTFDGAPALTSLAPTVGATAGGTVVTLSGAGFAAGVEVHFGAEAATTVTRVSSTTLTAVAPPSPMRVVGVTVRNADGQSTTLASAFRYVSGATVTELAPSAGDVSGGTVVRLSGEGFGAQTQVRFGASASPLVTLVNATTLDAVTPPHAAGAVDVTVVNPDGAEATLEQAFTFTRSAPRIAAVAPASGTTSGGTLLSISGGGFAPTATVTVGGAAMTDVVMASPELLRGRAPAHAAGTVDVVVTNDDGQSATAVAAYTYVATPEGNTGVADGGNGGLGEAPTTEPPPSSGCGCAGVEGSALMFAALGLLCRRRRS